jgi:hypothetical protein
LCGKRRAEFCQRIQPKFDGLEGDVVHGFIRAEPTRVAVIIVRIRTV